MSKTAVAKEMERLIGAAQVLRNYGIEWEIGNSTKKCHTPARISERSRFQGGNQDLPECG